MGWKGTLRSIDAAIRAADRDAKRRQRELEKRQKYYDKMAELEQAAYQVEAYENHIEVIQSLHKECSQPINWHNIATAPQPEKPVRSNNNEKVARSKFEHYKPGILDRLFKRVEKKKARLQAYISYAIEDDDSQYKVEVATWENNLQDWKEGVDLAQLILKGNNEAKLHALKDFDPFSEISNLGSKISVSVNDKGVLEGIIHIHGDDIVPGEIKSLLKSGKLTSKKMPKGQFNEIYQDYVCSCVLRVANELLAIIPDNIVIVTAVDELLNTRTGHLEVLPILSACIPRRTLEKLNMENIDPSNSMDNFIHNMSFKRTQGFEAVTRVEPIHN